MIINTCERLRNSRRLQHIVRYLVRYETETHRNIGRFYGVYGDVGAIFLALPIDHDVSITNN